LSLPPVVETDASDYTIAGILTLSGAELHYDTHDKDLLAIFEALKNLATLSRVSSAIFGHRETIK
jgi:hypothetical protein